MCSEGLHNIMLGPMLEINRRAVTWLSSILCVLGVYLHLLI